MIWVNKDMQTEYQEQQTSTPEPTVIGPPASGSQLPFSALAKVKNIQAENIFIKASWIPKNIKFYNKRTPDEHVVILAQGEIVVFDKDNNGIRYIAPASTVIPANTRFAAYTLEDCVLYCVHGTLETDPEVLDKTY